MRSSADSESHEPDEPVRAARNVGGRPLMRMQQERSPQRHVKMKADESGEPEPVGKKFERYQTK